jgi:hypothetical protein
MRKLIFILLLFIYSIALRAQNLNIGATVGVIPTLSSNSYTVYNETSTLFTLGAAIEFRPGESMFSLNTDPFVFLNASKFVLTEPLYVKVSFGNAFKFSPVFGGFIRTNGNYGFLFGASIDYVLNDKCTIFLNGHLYQDYYKIENPLNSGGTSAYISNDISLLMNVGIKRTLKLNCNK